MEGGEWEGEEVDERVKTETLITISVLMERNVIWFGSIEQLHQQSEKKPAEELNSYKASYKWKKNTPAKINK